MGSEEGPLVYLAGPGVFRPDVVDHAIWLLERCRAYGMRGLFPYDVEDVGFPPRADSIYRESLNRLEKCDVVMADLNPFRGQEPDSGTVLAIGYALAKGKEVFAHIRDGRMLKDRIGDIGPEGWRVEDFGLPLNAMLGVSVSWVVGNEDDCLQSIAACAAYRRTCIAQDKVADLTVMVKSAKAQPKFSLSNLLQRKSA